MIEHINKGTILISKPLISDKDFDRSVILITEHNYQGSIGFIMNKKLDCTLDKVLPVEEPIEIYYGGPVGTENLYFMHSRPDLISGGVPLSDHIYWEGNLEEAIIAIQDKKISSEEIRFFLGYAGWNYNQLVIEYKSNSWFTLNTQISLESIQEGEWNIWQKMIQKIGGENLLWINTPFDPKLN